MSSMEIRKVVGLPGVGSFVASMMEHKALLEYQLWRGQPGTAAEGRNRRLANVPAKLQCQPFVLHGSFLGLQKVLLTRISILRFCTLSQSPRFHILTSFSVYTGRKILE
eukprot:4372316-Amphidinium_carterae.1